MQIDTLIIGYVPLSDTTGKKPREIRDDKYYKELFSAFDLGTVHYASRQDYKTKIDEINPLVVVSLGGDYYAEEVNQYKKDSLLYATDDAGSIFYRKADVEEKKAKQRKTFEEIAIEGDKFGTHKFISLKGRFHGRESPGHEDRVRVEDANGKVSYQRNFINFNVDNFNVEERGSLLDIISENNSIAFLVVINPIKNSFAFSLRAFLTDLETLFLVIKKGLTKTLLSLQSVTNESST